MSHNVIITSYLCMSVIVGLVVTSIVGCSAGPSRAEREKARQAYIAEQRRKQKEELQNIFKMVADSCDEKGMQKIIIKYDDGTKMLCVSDYETCINAVNESIGSTKYNPGEKQQEAEKLCGNAFPE